jgi:hypothetical protein
MEEFLEKNTLNKEKIGITTDLNEKYKIYYLKIRI